MRLQSGVTFAGYLVESRLGRGGMATVYLVREQGLNRKVALKVLPEHLVDDAEFAARFEQEAQVIASLDHPNIIPLYRFGIDDETPWMALRYVDGGDFAHRLASRPLPVAEGIEILRAIASALDYAHRRGVVHRDLKPQNILLSSDGAPYLADFGVAKLLEGSGKMRTATGGVLGTPAYMAPEQAQGQKLGPYTDVYALAIICFQWLTGSLPFDADTPHAVLLKHVTEPLPTQPLALLPPAVAQALTRGLAKAPEQRTASAGALIAELERALFARGDAREPAAPASPPSREASAPLAAVPPPAPPPPAPPPLAAPMSPARRSRAGLAGAAIAVVLLVAAGAFGLRAWRDSASGTPAPSTDDSAHALEPIPAPPSPAAQPPEPSRPVEATPALGKAAAESDSAGADVERARGEGDTSSASPADALIAKHVAAHGGVERWKALRTLRVTGTARYANGAQFEFEVQTRRPGKQVSRFVAANGASVLQIYDGSSGWNVASANGRVQPVAMTPGQLKEAAYSADLDGLVLNYRAKGNSVRDLGASSVGGARVRGLEVRHSNGDVDTLYVDADSYVLRRSEHRHTIDGARNVVDVDYRDYRNIDGYVVSFAQEFRTRGNPQASFSVAERTFEPNVAIDDDAFEVPE